eukprot:sb/3463079/
MTFGTKINKIGQCLGGLRTCTKFSNSMCQFGETHPKGERKSVLHAGMHNLSAGEVRREREIERDRERVMMDNQSIIRTPGYKMISTASSQTIEMMGTNVYSYQRDGVQYFIYNSEMDATITCKVSGTTSEPNIAFLKDGSPVSDVLPASLFNLEFAQDESGAYVLKLKINATCALGGYQNIVGNWSCLSSPKFSDQQPVSIDFVTLCTSRPEVSFDPPLRKGVARQGTTITLHCECNQLDVFRGDMQWAWFVDGASPAGNKFQYVNSPYGYPTDTMKIYDLEDIDTAKYGCNCIIGQQKTIQFTSETQRMTVMACALGGYQNIVGNWSCLSSPKFSDQPAVSIDFVTLCTSRPEVSFDPPLRKGVARQGTTITLHCECNQLDVFRGDMQWAWFVDGASPAGNKFQYVNSPYGYPTDTMKIYDLEDIDTAKYGCNCIIGQQKTIQFTSETQRMTVMEPPGKPKDITLLDKTGNSLEISWQNSENMGVVINYEISYKGESESYYRQIRSVEEQRYTLTGLNALTQYSIKIVASNYAGEGDYSDVTVFNTSQPSESKPVIHPPKDIVYNQDTQTYLKDVGPGVDISLSSTSATLTCQSIGGARENCGQSIGLTDSDPL